MRLLRKPRRDVASLIEALAVDDWGARAEAAVALGDLADSRAVAPLLKAIVEEEVEKQRWADEYKAEVDQSGGWSPVGGSAALRAWKNRIIAANVGFAAEAALVRIGSDAVRPLVLAIAEIPAWLDARRWSVIGARIGRVLRDIGAPEAAKLLVDALDDENGDVRELTAEALAQLGDPVAVGRLRQAATDAEARVRESAERALTNIADPAQADADIEWIRAWGRM